tara:strand:+ start:338 stop:571 length:234 start_codon:yes stop_codon:yes gene_type:complete
MKLNYLTLEIERIEDDIANGFSSLAYKEKLSEFKLISKTLNGLSLVEKEALVYKDLNDAWNLLKLDDVIFHLKNQTK